ncbi:hypothetical protein, partial [Planococcus glaciei]|uniref:hypothetical protein n=1 Tax=Planococcus glaciei TaxID=459472 RepID=UPI001C733E8D
GSRIGRCGWITSFLRIISERNLRVSVDVLRSVLKVHLRQKPSWNFKPCSLKTGYDDIETTKTSNTSDETDFFGRLSNG